MTESLLERSARYIDGSARSSEDVFQPRQAPG